jgi:predicted N-acyltransferase
MIAPATLTTEILTTIEETTPQAWNRLAEGHAFASYDWYRYGEAITSTNIPRYVTVYDGDEPIARAAFWVTSREDIPITNTTLHSIVRWMLTKRPLLACRAPAANYAGLILPTDDRREACVALLVEAAEQIAEEFTCCAVVFDYLTPDHEADWPEDYIRVDSFDPGTTMHITWPDHDAYLRSLKKKRRQDYKYNQRIKQDEGITIHRYDHIPSVEEALPLLENLYDKYDLQDRFHLQPQLEHAHMVDVTWLEARQAGELVGCLLILGDGDTHNFQLIGRSYTVDSLYFLLLDEGIKAAIEEGVRVLRGGSKVYGAKTRRGFSREDGGHVMLRTRLPLLHLLTKAVE